MTTLGNTLIVNRGEKFTLKRSIVNSLSEPYVLYKDVKNQYLKISVLSNSYRLDGRYNRYYWLDLSPYPKFKSTLAVFLRNGLSGGLPSGYEPNDCIFYIMDDIGNKTYYRWDLTMSNFRPYSFTFVKTFLPTDTYSWIEQIYTYEIAVVSGNSTFDLLVSIYSNLYPSEIVPLDNETLYYKICKIDPSLVENININSPLANIATCDILQQPSKLIVKTN